jgi:hypothetical protein
LRSSFYLKQIYQIFCTIIHFFSKWVMKLCLTKIRISLQLLIQTSASQLNVAKETFNNCKHFRTPNKIVIHEVKSSS